jgi:chorismate synthase
MASNTFGSVLRLTTFGESHGTAIGGILDGFPSGVSIDHEFLQREMQRRKPGQSDLVSPRKEEDEVVVLSGVFEGVSTGTPLGFVIYNKDQKSSDYDALKEVFRPGHADFTYAQKYGNRDYRGGGRSSARETAVRVAAGAFAKMALQTKGISCLAYVSGVKDIHVPVPYTQLDLSLAENSPVRCPHAATAERMVACIERARDEKDSVGGIITGVIKGVDAGLGEPVFDKLHAVLGHALLSINAVKSFEIGDGLSATLRYGSANNDTAESNRDGGIQGGISNGKDIWFRVGFKPVSTIGKEQDAATVTGDTVKFSATGRHDPCVLPRAVPIVEAMSALVILDHLLLQRMNRW